jgi:hypothetical protein
MTRSLKDRETLRNKVAELMALEKTEWPGHAFADEDGSFGVTCGKVKGGYYAAYFLSDHLAAQKLFTGRQKERTDLDTAVYECWGENPFQIFPEVRLHWNQNQEVELRITTDKPLDKIIHAIDCAISAEQAEIRQKEQREREYREERERDRQREIRGPVVSKQADLAILQEYVEQMTRTHLPHTAFYDFKSERPDERRVLFTEDERIRNQFRFYSSGWGEENNYFNYTLRDVFNGFCAVSPNQFAPKGELHFDIAGNPARLVQDILEHDFKSVAAVRSALVTKNKLSIPDKAAFDSVIAEYGQKDSDANVITQGSAEKIKVGKPIKFGKGPA